MAFLLATSILVRLANASDAQHLVAAQAVLELHRRGEVLHLTLQVLIEFRNGATRPKSANGPGAAADHGRDPGCSDFKVQCAAAAAELVVRRGRHPMRNTLLAVVVLVTVTACRAEDAPKASGTLHGKKVLFPGKSVADGVKAAVGLLQSCHDHSLFQADELKKAERGDHVRLVFAKPVTARVMNEKIEFSELVFRLPMNTGVFWVRTGAKWRRYSKYEFQKEKPFTAWLRAARPAD